MIEYIPDKRAALDTVHRIVHEHVCAAYEVDKDDIFDNSNRGEDFSNARHTIFWALNELGYTFFGIAKAFDTQYNVVKHGVNKITRAFASPKPTNLELRIKASDSMSKVRERLAEINQRWTSTTAPEQDANPADTDTSTPIRNATDATTDPK